MPYLLLKLLITCISFSKVYSAPIWQVHDPITNSGNLVGASFCEASEVGEEIYTLVATGSGTIRYSIIDPVFAAYVEVDELSGKLTLKRKFDRESAGVFFGITISASDDSDTTTAEGRVTIKDANDNDPFIENLPYKPTTYESPWNEKRLLNIVGSDADNNDAGASFWKIEDSSEFEIENSNTPNTFIDVNGTLDYEISPVITFSLNLSDLGTGAGNCGPDVTRSTETTVVVTLLDGPDQQPVFSGTPYSVYLEENAMIGQSVKNVIAQDRDFGLNWKMDYSIIPDGYVEKIFEIDSSTGEITVKVDNIDREDSAQGNVIQFEVKAEEVVPLEWQSKSGYGSTFPMNNTADVTVIITDVNDNSPTFYELVDSTNTTSKVKQNNFVASIAENTAALVSVPELFIYVQDTDEGSNATFKMEISGAEANIFEVTPADVYGEATLTLRVKDSSALDYEKVKSFTVILTATENATPEKRSATATVTINLEDINDVSPEFVESTISASVAENSEIGTFVTAVTAFDQDNGTYGEVTYFIVSGGDEFKIDTNSGNVTVNGTLDREKISSYYITIQARDGGGSFATAALQVEINDVNDNSPSFQRSSYSGTVIQENEANFNAPLLIYATDDDEKNTKNSKIEFSIIGGDYMDNFTITTNNADNPTEGDITLKSPFDFESLDPKLLDCNGGFADIKLTVMAKDQGTPSLNSTVDVTITLENVNDNAPAFNQSSYTASVKEGSTPGTEVVKVFATDGDACNNDITYSISSDLPVEFLSAFSIETINSGSFGLLTVRDGSLDRETRDEYQIEVFATDQQAVHTTPVNVTVTILDVNDEFPEFDGNDFDPLNIPEDVEIDETVWNVTATDKDESPNLNYTFSVVSCFTPEGSTGSDCEDWFRMETFAQSGRLIVAKPLDREAVETFNLQISVTDENAEVRKPQTALHDLSVTITDVNDNPPEFDESNLLMEVNEEEIGSVIGQVTAKDSDKGSNGVVKYSVMDEYIAIGATTGQLTTEKEIDRETNGNWMNVTVIATDEGSPPLSSNVTVAIRINDVNDNSPNFTKDTYDAVVSESATNGTFVVDVEATDRDEGNNGQVRYSIIAGNELSHFTIDEITGEITVAQNAELDRERWPNYDLTIRAQDAPGQSVSNIEFAPVNINITDVNDNPPEFTQQTYVVSNLREDASVGELVVTVQATDQDEEKNKEITYSIVDGNDAGYFKINSSSGEVLLESSIANKNASYSLKLMAFDGGEPPLNSTARLDIDVIDVNLNTPQFTNLPSSEEISVYENLPAGTFVFQVTADDKDRGRNGEVFYSLADQTSFFRIQAEGGNITTFAALDREQNEKFEVTVVVTDGSAAPRSNSTIVTIVVLDVDDNQPSYEKNKEQTITVVEEQKPFVIPGTIVDAASDKDAPENAVNYYFISGGTGYDSFSLNSTTRQLSTTKLLDREASPELDLVIMASNESAPNNPKVEWDPDTLSDAYMRVIIQVEDVNDSPPIFTKTLYEWDMPYDTQPSADVTLTQVQVVDKDVGDNAIASFTIVGAQFVENDVGQDKDGTFGITPSLTDPSIGNIFLAKASGVSADSNGYYQLMVQATDGEFTETTDVIIGIVNGDETVLLYSSMTPEQFRANEDQFIADMESILDAKVYVDKVIPHTADDTSLDAAQSDIYIHAKNNETNELVPADTIIKELERQDNYPVLNEYQLVGTGNTGVVVDNTLKYFQAGLIIACAAILLVIIIFSIAILCMRRSYNRKINVSKATEQAAQDMLRMKDVEKMGEVPNTNIFGENENPLYLEDQKGTFNLDMTGWPDNQESRDDDDSLDDNAVDSHDSAIGFDANDNGFADQPLEDGQFPIDFDQDEEDHAKLSAALNAALKRRGEDNINFLFDGGNGDDQTGF